MLKVKNWPFTFSNPAPEASPVLTLGISSKGQVRTRGYPAVCFEYKNDIWLLSYEQNSFGCFRDKSQFQFFPITPKIVLLIAQQPNIAQRPFCIQNERQDILYHLI